MKVKLVFEDWQRNGKSVYETSAGIVLTLNDFHHGTVFDGEIDLDPASEQELKTAMENGYKPVFYLHS